MALRYCPIRPLFLATALLWWSAPVSAATALPSQFHLTGLDRSDLTSEDLRGRPAVIQFWASWCKSCSSVSQELDNLIKDPPKKLAYLSISLDESKPAAHKGMLKSRLISSAPKDYYYDAKRHFSEAIGEIAVPTVLLIDKHGSIVARISGHFGTAQREEIRSKLLKISL